MNAIRLIRGIILNAIAGEDDIVRCSVAGLEGEVIDDVDILGAYGVNGVPADGTECIALQTEVGTVVVAVANSAIAPGGLIGDVVIHSSKNTKIVLYNDSNIRIESSSAVTVDAPSINLGGDTGLRKLLDERFVNSFNAHTHPAPGGTTSTPAPVALLAVSTSVVEGK